MNAVDIWRVKYNVVEIGRVEYNAVDVIVNFQKKAPLAKFSCVLFGVLLFTFAIFVFLEEKKIKEDKRDYFMSKAIIVVIGMFFLFSIIL